MKIRFMLSMKMLLTAETLPLNRSSFDNRLLQISLESLMKSEAVFLENFIGEILDFDIKKNLVGRTLFCCVKKDNEK